MLLFGSCISLHQALSLTAGKEGQGHLRRLPSAVKFTERLLWDTKATRGSTVLPERHAAPTFDPRLTLMDEVWSSCGEPSCKVPGSSRCA
jgi:hypothetical protein